MPNTLRRRSPDSRSPRVRARGVSAFADRPMPPAALAMLVGDAEDRLARYEAAPDVAAWMRRVFIETVHLSPVLNVDHAHLATARIGVLWTNADNRRQGRTIIGTAEIPNGKGDRWHRGRLAQQLRAWFPEFDGEPPDFVITLSAPFAHEASDAQFCALVEHELYHCGQQCRDGLPVFSTATGCPLWAIRGHDVEQFVGVVRRYGKDAAGVRALVEAAAQADREPVFAAEALAGVCGACAGRPA